jgi:small GTP-binding protein
MKRRRTDGINRRGFLTAAAATVAGVALNSLLCGRAYANDGLKVYSNADASGGLKVMQAGQVIQKKVCMLGATGVGKTSLVRRYVESIYSDKYLNTVGVKVDKKVVDVEGKRMVMLLWDIAGQDDFQSLTATYLRKANGILLVVDGTRRQTLEVALDFHRRIHEVAGPVPSVVLMLNKDDLSSQWEVRSNDLENLAAQKIPIVRGSAKTGEGVEEAFLTLATKMLGK